MRWHLGADGVLSIRPTWKAVAAARERRAERGTTNTIAPGQAWTGDLCEAAFGHYLLSQGIEHEHDGGVNDRVDFTLRGCRVEFKSRSVYSRKTLERENMADVLLETNESSDAHVYAFGFHLTDSGVVLLYGAIDTRDFRTQAVKRTHSTHGRELRRPHLSVSLTALFSIQLVRHLHT